jgi:hypothetical protein
MVFDTLWNRRKVLYSTTAKKPLPSELPGSRWAYRTIAKLGGRADTQRSDPSGWEAGMAWILSPRRVGRGLYSCNLMMHKIGSLDSFLGGRIQPKGRLPKCGLITKHDSSRRLHCALADRSVVQVLATRSGRRAAEPSMPRRS